jgi:hypothetical protein
VRSLRKVGLARKCHHRIPIRNSAVALLAVHQAVVRIARLVSAVTNQYLSVQITEWLAYLVKICMARPSNASRFFESRSGSDSNLMNACVDVASLSEIVETYNLAACLGANRVALGGNSGQRKNAVHISRVENVVILGQAHSCLQCWRVHALVEL